MNEQKELIYEQEWDVLVVLDSCRADYFDELWPYSSDSVRSPAAATPPWLDEVWLTDDSPDVTYISGHPVTEAERFGVEGMDEYTDYVPAHREAWDDILGCTRPEQIVDEAIAQEPPMVVHILQPHTPFVGELSIRAEQCLRPEHLDHEHPSIPERGEGLSDMAVYRLVQSGQVDPELIREAYADNVRLAIESVEPLLLEYNRVAITADHGEALGEDERWGHWWHMDETLQVPWYTSY